MDANELLQQMAEDGKGTLYLVEREGKANAAMVTSWDGKLTGRVLSVKCSFHNMAGRNGRRDFWFIGPDKPGARNLSSPLAVWHGFNVGDNQIAHCKRIKLTYYWRETFSYWLARYGCLEVR